MGYEINLEVAATIFDLLLFLSLMIKYKSRSSVNHNFKLFAGTVLLGTLLDVLSAVAMNDQSVSNTVKMVTNTCSFIMVAVASYFAARYLMSYVLRENLLSSEWMMVNTFLLLVDFAFLLLNRFFGFVFYFTEDGIYMHGPLYVLGAYGVPLYFVIFSGIFLLRNQAIYERTVRISVGCAFLTMFVAMAIQFFLLPHVLLTFFGASLALGILFLALETPEYERLQMVLAQLEQSQEELKKANALTLEANAKQSLELQNRRYASDQLIRELVRFGELYTESKPVAFKMEVSDLPKELYGDMERLVQVVENLITYAVEYTDEGSVTVSLALRTLPDGPMLCVSVKDTGCGIHEEAVSMLLNKDRLVSDAEKGEGLLTVIHVLELMGSQLQVQSVVGTGSTFYFAVSQEVGDGQHPVSQEPTLRREQAQELLQGQDTYNLQEDGGQKMQDVTDTKVEKSQRNGIKRFQNRVRSRAAFEPKHEFLDRLYFLDTVSGMSYAGGDEEFYKEILDAYMNSGREQELDLAYHAKDRLGYLDVLQDLKSNSRMIGAVELYEDADKMEQLVKHGSDDEIYWQHIVLVKNIHAMCFAIGIVLRGGNVAPEVLGYFIEDEKHTKPLSMEELKVAAPHVSTVEQPSMNRKDFMNELLLALGSAVDAKDSYTNGHSLRVAKYSREIARRMGLSQDNQEKMFAIGLLHDIGKIGIPDAIIHKKCELTDEEYETIKRHPIMGYEILRNIKSFPELAEGARYHHEYYDGEGYPEGLVGKAIPLSARIIAVADAYDAMTSRRSYSSVRSQEEVRKEIELGKEIQFDPEIADIMLQMMDEDQHYEMRAYESK